MMYECMMYEWLRVQFGLAAWVLCRMGVVAHSFQVEGVVPVLANSQIGPEQ